MSNLNSLNIPNAFSIHVKSDEQLKHWAYGVKQSILLTLLVCFGAMIFATLVVTLIGFSRDISGYVAWIALVFCFALPFSALFRKDYIIGLTDKRFLIVRIKTPKFKAVGNPQAQLNLTEYELENLPRVKISVERMTSIIKIDNPGKSFWAKFPSQIKGNYEQIKSIIIALEAEAISPPHQNEISEKNQSNNSVFRENDNLGTRHDSKSISLAYWMGERMNSTRKDPFVMFTFRKEEDARAALLELPCIHIASDTQKLICTKRLIFGYYAIEDVYETILCGDALTVELWELAKASFSKHGGEKKNELAPTQHAANTPKTHVAQPEKIVYVREDRISGTGGIAIYRIYKGPDEQSAMAYLQQNPVTQNLLYLVVETPEGNFCRDSLGIYKEDS